MYPRISLADTRSEIVEEIVGLESLIEYCKEIGIDYDDHLDYLKQYQDALERLENIEHLDSCYRL